MDLPASFGRGFEALTAVLLSYSWQPLNQSCSVQCGQSQENCVLSIGQENKKPMTK